MPPSSVTLQQTDWQARVRWHQERLTPFVAEHLARRSRREKHPVWDFLFEYYSYRPGHLLKWSPGMGATLAGEAARDFLQQREYSEVEQGVALDPTKFPIHRLESVEHVLRLLQCSADRAPSFGCYGLHEWAMVYRAGEVRHGQVGLRLSDELIAAAVEETPLRCTHYDAFRFFTPAAAPLNTLQPASDNRAAFEQRGCIHANMDLYKHSRKFFPWTSAEVSADAFLLAIEAREIDMCASPYDLASFGFPPIAIETVAGKREYVEHQKRLAERAQPIRLRLIAEMEGLVETVNLY